MPLKVEQITAYLSSDTNARSNKIKDESIARSTAYLSAHVFETEKQRRRKRPMKERGVELFLEDQRLTQ